MTESRAKPLAWITGAGGLIGHRLVGSAPALASRWQVCGLTRSQLDLLDFAAVHRAFNEYKPQLILHCAALTRTPDCQAQPDLARRLNVELPALLAELAADIPFVLFSTDMIFDGRTGDYTEESTPNPLSVYGETKMAAERVVLANPRHLVIRTSLNFGASPTGDRGFNEQLRRLWQRGETLRLFTDEFRCPIPVAVTARATWELVQGNHAGLFHVAGSERLSRYEMGGLLAARWPQLLPKLVAASIHDYCGEPRPADTSLNCSKAQAVLSFRLPRLSEWLRANKNEVI